MTTSIKTLRPFAAARSPSKPAAVMESHRQHAAVPGLSSPTRRKAPKPPKDTFGGESKTSGAGFGGGLQAGGQAFKGGLGD